MLYRRATTASALISAIAFQASAQLIANSQLAVGGPVYDIADYPPDPNATSLFKAWLDNDGNTPLPRLTVNGDTYDAEFTWAGTPGAVVADDQDDSSFTFGDGPNVFTPANQGGLQTTTGGSVVSFVTDALIDNGDGTYFVSVEFGFFDSSNNEIQPFVPDQTSFDNGAPITSVQGRIGDFLFGNEDRIELVPGSSGPLSLPITQLGLVVNIFNLQFESVASIAVDPAQIGFLGDTSDPVGWSGAVNIVSDGGQDLAGLNLGLMQFNWLFQAAAPPPVLCGDVNDDGVFDLGDVDPFVALLSGDLGATGNAEAADVNANGTLDTQDLALFINGLLADGVCPD
ncbi:MAG: dockerin type I domain-containing protein [Planctomycetota bacterium]